MQLALFSTQRAILPPPTTRPQAPVRLRLMCGVVATRMLEAHPELKTLFAEELDRVLTRPADRALFGLRSPFQLVLPFQLEFAWMDDEVQPGVAA